MLLGAEIMPSFLKDRSIRTPLYGLYAVMIAFAGILAYYNWIIAVVDFYHCIRSILSSITEIYSSAAADRGVYCDFILSIKKSR